MTIRGFLKSYLKPGAVDDLVVDSKLTSAVVDDHNPHTAPTVSKGVIQLVPEGTLVNDGQGLNDVAGLGHGNNAAVVDVENAILLEDGPEHGLHIDRGGRVAHEAGLFLQLLGEEINPQIAVLAGLSRSRDTDDLARTALEHNEVANTNMVGGDRHGAGSDASGTLNEAIVLAGRLLAVTLDNSHLFTLVATAMDRMQEAVGGTLDAATEGVVAAFVVVVAHSGFFLVVNFLFGFDVHVFSGCAAFVFDVVGGAFAMLVVRSLRGSTLVLYVVGWIGTATILALGDVELGLALRASLAFDVDVNLGAASWFSVSSNTR